MNCKKCSAPISSGAKYCSVCEDGKDKFKPICPYCGSEMSKGKAQIKGTFSSFLIFGFSYQHLFFKDKQGNKSKVMKSRGEKEAYSCSNCEGLFIPS